DVGVRVDLVLRDDVALGFAVIAPLLVRMEPGREEIPDALCLVAAQITEPLRAQIEIATPLLAELRHQRVTSERDRALPAEGATLSHQRRRRCSWSRSLGYDVARLEPRGELHPTALLDVRGVRKLE